MGRENKKLDPPGPFRALELPNVNSPCSCVHERILLLRFVELLTAITSDLPMKPGRTRNNFNKRD